MLHCSEGYKFKTQWFKIMRNTSVNNICFTWIYIGPLCFRSLYSHSYLIPYNSEQVGEIYAQNFHFHNCISYFSLIFWCYHVDHICQALKNYTGNKKSVTCFACIVGEVCSKRERYVVYSVHTFCRHWVHTTVGYAFIISGNSVINGQRIHN